MSIKIMTYIWEYSPHSGSDLLMLLALADHANDQGMAWPSLPTLAQKCRIQKRQAIYILQKLEKEGSIGITHGQGRGHLSVYTIKGAPQCTFSPKGAAECTISEEKVQPSAPFEQEKVHSNAPIPEEKVHSSVIKGALQCTPSGTVRIRKERSKIANPTDVARVKPRRLRRCPPDYQPSMTLRIQCQEKWPSVDFDEELEAMRDWEFKDPKTDWDATLRNWVRKAAKEASGTGRRISREEQRAIDDARSNKELEDLALGVNTHNSVWAPVERHGEDVPRDAGHRREGGLLAGGR